MIIVIIIIAGISQFELNTILSIESDEQHMRTFIKEVCHLVLDLVTCMNFRFFPSIIENHYKKKYAVPEIIYIEGTNVCNAMCVFCIYRKINTKKVVLDMPTFSKVVDEYVKMGGENIGITPTIGDPLLDPFFCDRLTFLDNNKSIKNVKMFTNLLGLSDSHLELLESLRNTRMWLTVSICGFDRDNYKRLMGVDGFEKLKKNLLRLSAIKNKLVNKNIFLRNYGVDKCNETDIYKFLCNYTVFKESNVMSDRICIRGDVYDNWGGDVEEDIVNAGLKLAIKTRKRYGPCVMTFYKPIVTSSGDVALCECRDGKRNLVVGNVTNNSLKELLNGKCADNVRQLMYKASDYPDSCKTCTLYRSIYDPMLFFDNGKAFPEPTFFSQVEI